MLPYYADILEGCVFLTDCSDPPLNGPRGETKVQIHEFSGESHNKCERRRIWSELRHGLQRKNVRFRSSQTFNCHFLADSRCEGNTGYYANLPASQFKRFE